MSRLGGTMGIDAALTSPALCTGEDGAERRVRVIGSARRLKVLRGDPITLTASRLDLSRVAGEVS